MKEKIKVSIDTNCIIALFSPDEDIHRHMVRIREMHQKGEIELYVSLKTIEQLSKYRGDPVDYANSLLKLPNYPVGAWKNQVGTWNSLAGTWDNAKKNEELQEKIHHLAKKGVDIRDRQIVIDSYLGEMQVLLTNDRDLCDKGPRNRLKKELGIFVIMPKEFLSLFPKVF